MQSKDTFSSYNPIINFVFFIGAIVLGMFFVHPVFLVCSFVLAFAYYITVQRGKGLKFLLAMIPLILVLSLINPLLNDTGATILFVYFGRHFTLEALYYGITLAVMFASIIGWFASYNSVMTSDKFVYIFGRLMPSVSLVLSMILRLLPNYQSKAKQIATTRMCVGKAGDKGEKKEKIENGMTVLSSLLTWALEGGIITADSMRSRGYGTGPRTNFAIYRFDKRDLLLLMTMIGLMTGVLVCSFMGGTTVVFDPTLWIAFNKFTIIGGILYFLFLLIPTAINITEAVVWHILRSRI